MVDMGFEPDVNYILDQLPYSNLIQSDHTGDVGAAKYRQTTMFSATMPPLVERLARKYLRQPAMVTIGTVGQAVNTVEQRVEMTTEERKKTRILEVLNSDWEAPIIIFVSQKRTVDLVGKSLEKNGVRDYGL